MTDHAHKPVRGTRFGAPRYCYAECSCGEHIVETFYGWDLVLPGSRAYRLALSKAGKVAP